MKKIDVLIYFEHEVRELDACIILKYKMEKLGLTAEIVSTHRNRYWNFVKYKPKLLVVPFLFANEGDIVLQEFREMYGDVLVLNLHHEQLFNDMTKSHFMPKNEEASKAFHLAWGEIFSKALLEAGVEKDKLIVAGNPRTDNFYYTDKTPYHINKGYNKLIFIPMSFAWAFLDESYFLDKAKLDPEMFHKQKKLTAESAEIFLRTIRHLAKRNPDKLFILRPHPFEKNQTYIEYLKTLEDVPVESNIEVLQENNVYYWTGISDLTIGWITTVSMEASLFRRKNVIYNPIKLPDAMKTEFINLYDEIIDSEERLFEIVSNLDNYNAENSKLVRYLDSSMGIADGKVNERIAIRIKEIIEEREWHQSFTAEYFINLVKAIIIDTIKNVFIRLNVLSKYFKFYEGIEKDLLSYADVKKRYDSFKSRWS